MTANTDMLTPIGLIFSPLKAANEVIATIYTPFESRGSVKYSDEIYEIRVRNVWIGHGVAAFFGSLFSAPLTGSAITHWWVEIKTTNGHWYCAQWESTKSKGHYLCISRLASRSAVTERGKWEACCKGQSKDITTRYQYKCGSGKRSIGDLIKQVMKKQGQYSLVSNNCQHFGVRVYQWI